MYYIVHYFCIPFTDLKIITFIRVNVTNLADLNDLLHLSRLKAQREAHKRWYSLNDGFGQ